MKITVSVEVRIVNPFVFLEIKARLSLNFNPFTFGHCVFFSGKKMTALPSPDVPIRLWLDLQLLLSLEGPIRKKVLIICNFEYFDVGERKC